VAEFARRRSGIPRLTRRGCRGIYRTRKPRLARLQRRRRAKRDPLRETSDIKSDVSDPGSMDVDASRPMLRTQALERGAAAMKPDPLRQALSSRRLRRT